VEFWQGGPAALWPGRAVIVGFPQDEGVRRNHGRPGAAEAPHEIRRWLYRLTPWDGLSNADLSKSPALDAGNVLIAGRLEDAQHRLGEIVGGILQAGAVPIVLGGGHETAYGHYLGYVAARVCAGVVNIDAHLDVRPLVDGQGHSGSPFRQALEHQTNPLPGPHYACLGAQPCAVSLNHWLYVHRRGGVVRWADELHGSLKDSFQKERDRLAALGCNVYLTFDADALSVTAVPGVSAPNPAGLAAGEVLECVRLAGRSPQVSSFDLVEINPRHDRDGQSARWAALTIWSFLVGLAGRPVPQKNSSSGGGLADPS
jgi:formiminoglutamase